ncbi:hypothetical protein RHMOL_Rhmol04G0005200 [Rhododendron molle]|uniref:Uncharacterized protein n=1 Tax=Rhododendron molle TaxID=49168 RepID=A0ACC0NVY1_RHOML|nr:hypothetical protein RHMOL_Rhmol04G0005200 [Rhododendron molle]
METKKVEWMRNYDYLNKVVSGGSRRAGIIGDKDSRESSSVAEWAQDVEFPNWSDQQILDANSTQEGKRWSSQQLHSSPAQLSESKPLYRASSYPEQQQQHDLHHQLFSSEPILVPKSSFTSYPTPGGGSQQSSPNYHLPHSNMPYHPGGPQMSLSTSNLSPYTNPQFQIGGNLPQYTPPGLSANSGLQNQWIKQRNMFPRDRSSILSNLLQQQLPLRNGLMPQQLMPQQQSQQHRPLPFQPSYGHLSRLQSQLFNPHDSPTPLMMNKLEAMLGLAELRDQRPRQCRKEDRTSVILNRAQSARANAEPHVYLQVDALGRVAFPSIRRPRPLLEVNPPNSFGVGPTGQKTSEKPSEYEPMLAARVAIEDGLCLLLDVDDIDRFMPFNQLQDIGETHLRRRRQVLLEGLATSLQLVDPLGKNSHIVDLAPKDDLIFLRFLFGGIPTDSGAAKSSINLSRVVTPCVGGMELKALGACLASVVYSSEHPPFRPIGNSAGDKASVILKSVRERATELLTDPTVDGNCSMPNRAFWQAFFDAFFWLLTKYCFNKYDTIMQSIILQALPETAVIGADATRAIISKEMPVELLHASFAHNNEHQRKLLLDVAQRSMPVLESNGHTGGSGDS